MACFSKLSDTRASMRAPHGEQYVRTPCPLCRRETEKGFCSPTDGDEYSDRVTDTTWCFNTITNEWSTLANAPAKHMNHMILEQPLNEWVSTIPDSPAPLITGKNYGFEAPLNYHIKTNTWSTEMRIAPRPAVHANGDPPVSLMVP